VLFVDGNECENWPRQPIGGQFRVRCDRDDGAVYIIQVYRENLGLARPPVRQSSSPNNSKT